ncbi:NCS1 family nucleobase:cation symporter-1 [Microbacterium bovistercoris]|uniref:NCS1 family nucleobase:cation symporter-1 n=1 Tax=Microbacterium bovistercoris TaxID=2293570 RepID=A0A371NSZ2_9MICO|nr:NCS1 family nucleobase:cation symporter-1 [Microbacterium bovistercoris]REJ05240.1 NCS1 family nucleobase:cation symporter-1 [Microbacterium bovistercoris]
MTAEDYVHIPSRASEGLAEPPSALVAVQAGISPRLYNNDLAPTTREGRHWSAYSIFTLWANDVHSLGNYVWAIGLFSLGMSGGAILGSLAFGALFLFLLLSLSGFMGEKTGVPFPVMSRIAFGVHGAQIPALLRGGVAIAWFGIQTYLASQVLQVIIIALAPGAAGLQEGSFLGLSALGWITFLALWVLQSIIVSYGMEMIRKYEAFAGPIILATFVALAVWVLIQADFQISWSNDAPLTGADLWLHMLGGASAWVAIYGTFVLNFCDFTRGAKSKKAIIKGNFWGIPINMLFFGCVVVVLAGGSFTINGEAITSPADVVAAIPNTLLLVLASLALIVLTIAVNLMANFVAPTYALTNLFPKHLNFRRAALISAVIGLAILPWNLYNSPVVIGIFLNGLGALLGPLFGIIMVDYWLVKKQRINVPELYSEHVTGEYYYQRGFNPRAITALVISGAAALMLTFVPAFQVVSQFSWFLAAGLGAIVYSVLADRRGPFHDVEGTEIAVTPTH